jgi:hypothetical protein
MMQIPTSTEALKQIMGMQITIRSKNGEYTSDSFLKQIVDKQYNAFPEYFGMNKNQTGPSDLSTIQGTRRSGLTWVRKIQDKQPIGKGVLNYMKGIDGLKYISDPTTGENYYYIDNVLQIAQLSRQNDPDFIPSYKTEVVSRVENIHTTLQYELCGLGILCGYKIYVPNADRNKTIKNGQTINEDFKGYLVESFNQMNSRSDDIDCLWIDGENNVVKAFEVENSTGVDSGMSRMASLQIQVPCYIVGTQDNYSKKFMELKETSYKHSNIDFIYLDNKKVSREYNSINEHFDAYDFIEVRSRLEKKFK